MEIREKSRPLTEHTNYAPTSECAFRTGMPQRRRLRLAEYDYAQAGAYFVTVCTRGHACLFGKVLDGKMQRNAAGEAALGCWGEIPRHFPRVEVDAFVVMPNHVHGVLLFGEAEDAAVQGRAGHARPLQVVVGSFKSAVSRQLGAVWQRSYWDRVVRTSEELDQIRDYIEDNPLRWHAGVESAYYPGTPARFPPHPIPGRNETVGMASNRLGLATDFTPHPLPPPPPSSPSSS